MRTFVTDRRTDGQTDGAGLLRTRASPKNRGPDPQATNTADLAIPPPYLVSYGIFTISKLYTCFPQIFLIDNYGVNWSPQTGVLARG